MSVSKLLSRIVAPHIERDNLGDDKHEELLLHDRKWCYRPYLNLAHTTSRSTTISSHFL
jgi:hypothetical protein